jgi:hypothetical protein
MIRWAILLFGILNAILYSSLLPLFEGFDETFHYGYVQYVSTHGAFPVLGQTVISEEIWQALQVQPVSHYIQASTKAPTNFTDYYGLSNEQRSVLRKRLESIPSSDKYRDHAGLQNYEASQAPIPYLFMALPDRLMSGLPIVSRVLNLRLLLSLTSVVLIYFGMSLLTRQLDLSREYAAAATFCVYCSQMLYGAIAHVCNDSLAVPVMIFFIWSAVGAVRIPSIKSFAILATMLSLGLLVKAYFLFVLPVALVIVGRHLWRRRQAALMFASVLFVMIAPWYIRNLVLYHSVGGTVEKTAGFGLKQALQAFVHLPWRESITYMATSSIWTGNNSFTTFSARTLYVVLLLLAASAVLYIYHRKKARPGEMAVIGSIGFFCAGLLYVTLAFFYGTNGAAIAAVPWYTQVLLPPVMLMAFLSMSRSGSIGRYTAIATLLIWSYLICATYVLKLIPQYGGFTQPRAHVSDLYSWYVHQATERNQILTTMLLTPPWWVYLLTVAVVLLGISLCAWLITHLIRSSRPGIAAPAGATSPLHVPSST